MKSMANERGKAIDNTHLSIDQAEERGFIHRDYIAHCLRWTHVAKLLGQSQRYKTARILDVGCGSDLPLARLLYSSRYIVDDYVGVDYNKSAKFKVDAFHTGKFPMSAYGSVDFASDAVWLQKPQTSLADTEQVVVRYEGDNGAAEHPLPNFITSFEMLEHVESGHARATLKKMYNVMDLCRRFKGEVPMAVISTPCYDAQTGAAANHVNEMTYEALGGLIEDLGFVVENVYGTFASQKDYKDQVLRDGHGAIYNALSAYYDSNYLATIFAPMYPWLSRNALWVLRLPPASSPRYERKFIPLNQVKGPWSSSENWKDMARDDSYPAT
jgi:hypothetical protein